MYLKIILGNDDHNENIFNNKVKNKLLDHSVFLIIKINSQKLNL